MSIGATGDLVYLLFMEPWAAIKKLLLSVAVPPAPVRAPRQRPLAPSVASVTLITNDKGDNELVWRFKLSQVGCLIQESKCSK